MFIVLVHHSIIVGITISSVLIASCNKYPISGNIFSTQRTITTSYFRRMILGLVGKLPLGSKLISGGGVAIRMPWYAFFEKINSRGGASILDWRVLNVHVMFLRFVGKFS